jgi:hypothetical protein
MTNARFYRITDELLSAYLDDEVTAEERGWVEEAVAADATIAWRLSSLQQTVHLLRSLPAVAMPRSFVLSPEEATQEMVVQTLAPVTEPVRTLSAQKSAGGAWAAFQRWWGSGSQLWRNAAAMSLTLLLVLISAPRFLATGPMDAAAPVAAPAAVMAPAESVQEEIAPAASVVDAAAAPEVAGAVDTSSAADAGGGAEVATAAQSESAEDESLADSAALEDASAGAAATGAPAGDAASGNMVAAGEAPVGAAETACPADGVSCGVTPGGEGDAPAEMGLAMMPSGSGPTDPLGEAAAAGSAGDPTLRTGATEALVFPAAPPMAAAPAAPAAVENAAAESAPAESAPAASEAVVVEIPVAAAEAAAPIGEPPAAKQLAEATATALPAEQASAIATASPLPAATAAPEIAVVPAAELVDEAAIVAEAEVAEAAKPVEPVALAGKEIDQSSSETVATVVTAAPAGTLDWVAGGLWAATAATLLFGALWWRSRRP